MTKKAYLEYCNALTAKSMAEKRRDITVVIASSEDESVFNCIKSVNGEAEIVVSLTPYKPIEARLSKLGIPFTIVPRGNLGVTFNSGIELATTNKVIVMTDDAIFESGSIVKLAKGLDNYDACKARLSFQYDNRSFSRIIASARDFINSSPTKAYTPGLALRKDIKERIGGRFFDEQVMWGEDAEFSYRFHRNGLRFGYIRDAVVSHPPVSVKHDLKGAFLIGLCKRRSVDLGIREGDENIMPTLQRIFSGKTFETRSRLFKEKGASTLFYMFIWDSFYNLGYNLRRLGLSDPIEKRVWQGFGKNEHTRTDNF